MNPLMMMKSQKLDIEEMYLNIIMTRYNKTTANPISPEPASAGPILSLKILSFFSETTDKSHAAEAHAGDRTLISSYTWHQTLTPHPTQGTKRVGHDRELNIKPLSKQRFHCTGRILLKCPNYPNATVDSLHSL